MGLSIANLYALRIGGVRRRSVWMLFTIAVLMVRTFTLNSEATLTLLYVLDGDLNLSTVSHVPHHHIARLDGAWFAEFP